VALLTVRPIGPDRQEDTMGFRFELRFADGDDASSFEASRSKPIAGMGRYTTTR
jgi:hypothetical protein